MQHSSAGRSPRSSADIPATLAQAAVYPPSVGRSDQVDPELVSRVVDRFSEQVVRAADLPAARRQDVRESCQLRLSDYRSILRLTCTITGSSYEQPWDGSDAAVLALADEASQDTTY